MATFRYHSLAPLPEGGGRAFLGLAIIDEARAEPVVLVWLPEDLAEDIERSEQVQRDTERAALLEHPHIIRVYGFARLPQGLARVVEFADGENLRRILKVAGPLPARLAARLLADAAQGVHYAHLAGNDDGSPLLHGDLRPETLLVSYGGACKVSGYGASAFAKDATIRFRRVAPEQLLGGRGAMNVQTDVYLLGATLFECLTGRAPFEDAENFEQAVLSQDLDLTAYPQIPEAVAPVLARSLAKKARDRFPTALLFREALELAWPQLPDEAEVSRWLNELFPDQAGARAERRQLIDAGIASFARGQWEKQASQPSAQPPFPAVSPLPPPAPPPASAAPARAPAPPPEPAPVRRRVERHHEEEEAPPPPPARSRLPLAIAIGAAVLLGAVMVWMGTRDDSPRPLATRSATPDAGAPLAQTTPTEQPEALPPEVPDAGPPEPTPPPAPAQGTLALTVEPQVAVEIDGQAVGRSPVRVPLEPGRRRVRLIDRSKGIDVTRSVTVAAGTVTTESIFLQRGFVSISAPPGAIIEIDGRRAGVAPIKGDLEVYEGGHVLEVTVGKAKWREAFSVRPNQRVYFDVGPQYQ